LIRAFRVLRSIYVLKNGTSLLSSGERYGFTINPALSPSSDQIFARIAVSRMEFYNTLYNVTSDFTEFVYTIVNILTNTSSTHTLTLTPGQYSATDLATIFTAGLDSRLTFVYNSNTYMFTMAAADSTTYNFYLSTDTATCSILMLPRWKARLQAARLLQW
jgi:hypothetical protein